MKKVKEIRVKGHNPYHLMGTNAKLKKDGDKEFRDIIKEQLMESAKKKIKGLDKDYELVWGPQFNYIGLYIMCMFLVKERK